MKYLFLLIPDNSGSRLLLTYLSRCTNTVCQYKAKNQLCEGQELFGEWGYNDHIVNLGVWGLYEERFRDSKLNNWPKIKEVYHHNWDWKNDNKIYVSKTPQDILRVSVLQELFGVEHCYFIIMPRNPYAHLEGKLRSGHSATLCAQHWIKLISKLKELDESLSKDKFITLTYETLCKYPTLAEKNITNLLPELYDFSLSGTTNIASGIRHKVERQLRNMNEEKIARLKPWQIKEANIVYRENIDLLKKFGYDIIE